jgi:hypothetical protein
MAFIIEALATYSSYIYAACGLVALYHLYKLLQVRSERRQAVFSLEREKAVRELFAIFYAAMLLLAIMGGTYFVSTTLASAVEPLTAQSRDPDPALPIDPSATDTPLPVTPTDTPPPATATSTPTTTVTAEGTATPAAASTEAAEAPGEATPTPSPTPAPQPVVSAPACADSRAVILNPGNGQSVSGVIQVVGSATHENFQFYKVEFAPGANASGGFVYLGGGSSPVINGVLTSVDTGALGPGTWTLRLVVVDATGNFPAPCAVTITVG